MRKNEINKLLKYIGLAILIVTFAVNSIFTITNYIQNSIKYSYLYSEKAFESEFIDYLQEVENWTKRSTRSIKENTNKDYPALGATVEQITILDANYEMNSYIICIIAGVLIGITTYIIKKDYKIIIHYIAIYVLLYCILMILFLTIYNILESKGNMFSIEGYFGKLNLLSFGSAIDIVELTGLVLIPYTFIYILVCVTIHKVTKNKADQLNKELKK